MARVWVLYAPDGLDPGFTLTGVSVRTGFICAFSIYSPRRVKRTRPAMPEAARLERTFQKNLTRCPCTYCRTDSLLRGAKEGDETPPPHTPKPILFRVGHK